MPTCLGIRWWKRQGQYREAVGVAVHSHIPYATPAKSPREASFFAFGSRADRIAWWSKQNPAVWLSTRELRGTEARDFKLCWDDQWAVCPKQANAAGFE